MEAAETEPITMMQRMIALCREALAEREATAAAEREAVSNTNESQSAVKEPSK